MIYNQAFQSFNDQIQLTKEEKAYLRTLLEFKKFKKKELIVRNGEISNNYFYVIKGCLRSYIIDSKGLEQTIQFSSTNWWWADNESLLYDSPSKFNLAAVMDTEILIFNKKGKENSLKKYPKLERFYSIALEKSVIYLRNRLFQILSDNAETRYMKFCEQFPELINTVPQKQIASYLGVTPEFFSYMKRKINAALL